jgi:hypothetical protein
VAEPWTPAAPGAHEEFVRRLLQRIAAFSERRGHERAVVEIELADGGRLTLHSISAEPGSGFITLVPYPEDGIAGGELPPDEVIVPVTAIRRIVLNDAPDPEHPLGFSLPPQPIAT